MFCEIYLQSAAHITTIHKGLTLTIFSQKNRPFKDVRAAYIEMLWVELRRKFQNRSLQLFCSSRMIEPSLNVEARL